MAEPTPMKKQYNEIKAKYQDCMLFFRLGDFYEMFDDDAKIASRELDIALTTRDRNVENHQQYSVLNWVTANYPPTFLWHTFTDGLVPVQNSIRMAHALADAGVLTEMHIFPEGVHGLSLCNEQTARPGADELIVPECQCWPELAARFLKNAMKRS